jgi:hypothetical protein
VRRQAALVAEVDLDRGPEVAQLLLGRAALARARVTGEAVQARERRVQRLGRRARRRERGDVAEQRAEQLALLCAEGVAPCGSAPRQPRPAWRASASSAGAARGGAGSPCSSWQALQPSSEKSLRPRSRAAASGTKRSSRGTKRTLECESALAGRISRGWPGGCQRTESDSSPSASKYCRRSPCSPRSSVIAPLASAAGCTPSLATTGLPSIQSIEPSSERVLNS